MLSLIHFTITLHTLLGADRTVGANNNTNNYCCRDPGGSLSNRLDTVP